MGRGLSQQPQSSCLGIADFAAVILATHTFRPANKVRGGFVGRPTPRTDWMDPPQRLREIQILTPSVRSLIFGLAGLEELLDCTI
jgi:hypothetical protein